MRKNAFIFGAVVASMSGTSLAQSGPYIDPATGNAYVTRMERAEISLSDLYEKRDSLQEKAEKIRRLSSTHNPRYKRIEKTLSKVENVIVAMEDRQHSESTGVAGADDLHDDRH